MWARVPHPGSRPKNSRVIGLTTWVVNRRRNQSLVVAATVPPLLARSGGVCHRDLDHRCVPSSTYHRPVRKSLTVAHFPPLGGHSCLRASCSYPPQRPATLPSSGLPGS